MAATRLWPTGDKDDEYLAPSEVLRRLRNEFAIVKVDKERGRQHVKSAIEYLLQQKKRGHDPWGNIEEQLMHLKAAIGRAFYVYVGDEPGAKYAYLTTVVMPDEPLFFGYSSQVHQNASQALVKRCASALGYDIEN